MSVKKYHTTLQHNNTTPNASIIPAVPTIHGKRIKNSTPKMFCKHGK